ncbi:MAG: CHAP domain-containing protein [Elusimicrobiota bacterium]
MGGFLDLSMTAVLALSFFVSPVASESPRDALGVQSGVSRTRSMLPSGPLDPWAGSGAGVPGISSVVAFSPRPTPPKPRPLLHIPLLHPFVVRLRGAPAKHYDTRMARRMAVIAHQYNAGGFRRLCYAYSSWHLQIAGIISAGKWAELGIPTESAADFARWAERSPRLLDEQLRLRRISTPERGAAMPVGSLVVFGRGLCGYNRRHGHIGIVTSPGMICSDGCEAFRERCLKTSRDRRKVYVYVPVR